jgi:hypothetical protein
MRSVGRTTHVILLLALVVALSGCKPRVLVVGLDGVSWRLLDPLMEAGYTPTLEHLVRNGVRADLDCLSATVVSGCFCPPVWQSIFTGQRASTHRIFSFANRSQERKAATLWDVNYAFGGENSLFSLHNTWPPDPTAQIILSEPAALIFGHALYDVSGATPPAPGLVLTRPFDLLARLGLDDQARQGPTWAPFAKDRVSMTMLARLALRKRDMPLWERETELDVVLVHGTDRSAHMAWGSIQPDPGGPIDRGRLLEIAERWEGPVFAPPPFQWGSVVSQVLEADRDLGHLLDSIDYDYVVLLSDHGMARNPDPDGFPPGIHNIPEALAGIFVIHGPGAIRSGVDLGELSVLDVAPTLAYLLDLPIAEDLPGRTVEEAVEPWLLDLQPPRFVPSWDPYLPFR